MNAAAAAAAAAAVAAACHCHSAVIIAAAAATTAAASIAAANTAAAHFVATAIAAAVAAVAIVNVTYWIHYKNGLMYIESANPFSVSMVSEHCDAAAAIREAGTTGSKHLVLLQYVQLSGQLRHNQHGAPA